MSASHLKKKQGRAPETEKPEENGEAQKGMNFRAELYDWIGCMLVALIICVALFVFCIRIVDVSGTSMLPTLQNGDKMLVSPLFYTPQTWDVVVFRSTTYDPDKAQDKRVIATEGQVINIDFDHGIVYIDGRVIEENYINELTNTKLDFIGPKTVPEGCVFVMGDNRNASTDSRKSEIGMVDNRSILGKVYYVIFPISEIGRVS